MQKKRRLARLIKPVFIILPIYTTMILLITAGGYWGNNPRHTSWSTILLIAYIVAVLGTAVYIALEK